MGSRRTVPVGCAFLVGAVLLLSLSAQKVDPPDKKAPSTAQGLIRIDLLQKEELPLEPPLRNIFAPHRSQSPRDRAGQGRRPGEGPGDLPGGENPEGVEEELRPETEAVSWNLRYLGYVISSERTVAVVVFQGETMAVKPGEIIAEGVTILKITPDEIVYQGPDDLSRTVSLEGEDR